MALSYTTTIRNNRLDQITSAVGASGILKIYSGSVPANVGASIGASTLLAQLTCSATFAPASSGGVLTLNAIATESAADNTGTATYFRITTSGGTAQVQGTVSTSGADLNMNSAAIQQNAAVAVTSFTITEGNP